MTRYQALRRINCGPATAGAIAFLNWLFYVPAGEISFVHVVIEYDAEES